MRRASSLVFLVHASYKPDTHLLHLMFNPTCEYFMILGQVHPDQLWCFGLHFWGQYWDLYPFVTVPVKFVVTFVQFSYTVTVEREEMMLRGQPVCAAETTPVHTAVCHMVVTVCDIHSKITATAYMLWNSVSHAHFLPKITVVQNCSEIGVLHTHNNCVHSAVSKCITFFYAQSTMMVISGW